MLHTPIGSNDQIFKSTSVISNQRLARVSKRFIWFNTCEYLWKLEHQIGLDWIWETSIVQLVPKSVHLSFILSIEIISHITVELVPKLVQHLSWSGGWLWPCGWNWWSVEELNQRKEGDSGKKVGGARIQTSQSRALLLLPDFLPSYKYQLNKVRSQWSGIRR